jgi:hypothetical protein
MTEVAIPRNIVYPAAMHGVDVGSIVPSTRDLLQVLSTRRRSLALVGLLGGDRPSEEAARLADLNVSAFAALAAGPALALAARATKTVPSLCLGAAGDRDALLAARQHGADGVCLDARLPLDTWDKLAKIARTMRMVPLALAVDGASLSAAIEAGARAVVLAARSAEEVVGLAAQAPRSLTLVGHVDGADAAALRSLAGKVDAAIAPPAVHAEPGFGQLVADLDP